MFRWLVALWSSFLLILSVVLLAVGYCESGAWSPATNYTVSAGTAMVLSLTGVLGLNVTSALLGLSNRLRALEHQVQELAQK
jgi:hypothetical protein